MLQKLKNLFAENWLFFLFAIINTALVATLTFSQGVPCVVSGTSMAPTLESGSCYLAIKSHSVQPGDIVVLDSAIFDTRIVKRVIAIPGDTLAITNNVVYRNGYPLQEDYIAEAMVTEDIPLTHLSEGEYFVMGDNRNVSNDSRFVGLFKEEDICYTLPMQNQTLFTALFITVYVLLAFSVATLSYVEAWSILTPIAALKKRKA